MSSCVAMTKKMFLPDTSATTSSDDHTTTPVGLSAGGGRPPAHGGRQTTDASSGCIGIDQTPGTRKKLISFQPPPPSPTTTISTYAGGVGDPMTTSQSSQSDQHTGGGTQCATSGSLTTPNRSFIRTACQKAKRVRFLRNGDQFYKGVWYAISPERFRSFQALLDDLTKSIAGLPHGVRQIFSIDGEQKVSELDDLCDGQSYVCSSGEQFKPIDYENAKEPFWSYSLPRSNGHLEAAAMSLESSPAVQESNDFVHPKIVTVVRNGIKPRRVIRLLLNKRTARTFDQVLADITAAVKLDSGVVRKLFTLDGKLVTNLGDFFDDEDVFVAYGTERISVDDFYLDSEEYKFMFASRSRAAKSAKSPKVGRRFYGKGGGELCSPGLMSGRPVMRRFLHQRNQAILRPNSKSSPVHRRRIGGANQQPVTAEEKASIANDNNNSPRKRQQAEEDKQLTSTGKNDETSLSRPFPAEIEDRYAVGRLIGDGNFAIVHECVCKKSGSSFALKVIDKANCVGKENLVDNEVAILRRITNPNIVRLHEVWTLEHAYYLRMELIAGGDLFDELCSVRHYSEFDAAHLMKCLMSALHYLHQHCIVHRDVKPENLLVYDGESGRKQLKLADFGLACGSEKELFVVCGTPTYVAPEILSEIGYGVKVDVWAAGVILYVMLCGFPPFQSVQGNQDELFDQILCGRYTFPLECWQAVSSAAKGLIQGMLQLDANDRYSAEEVLMHPWVTCESRISPEYEELAAMAVRSQQLTDSNRDLRRSFYEDGNFEYSCQRRRSMDDLSFSGSQVAQDFDDDDDDDDGDDDDDKGLDRNNSFEFFESLIDAECRSKKQTVASAGGGCARSDPSRRIANTSSSNKQNSSNKR